MSTCLEAMPALCSSSFFVDNKLVCFIPMIYTFLLFEFIFTIKEWNESNDDAHSERYIKLKKEERKNEEKKEKLF